MKLNMDNVPDIIDEVTDLVAVVAIAGAFAAGAPLPQAALTTIAAIALGKRTIKGLQNK
jgi:hypothetical protein